MKIIIEGQTIGIKRKPGDVGYDIATTEDVVVMPYQRVMIPTNHRVQLPYEIEEQVRPRSGFSAKGVEAYPLELISTDVWKDAVDLDVLTVGTRYKLRSEYTMRFDADVILGTVDPDYTGEVMVIIRSNDNHAFFIPQGTRIAQAVYNKVEIPELVQGIVEENENRDGGFGSSGSI